MPRKKTLAYSLDAVGGAERLGRLIEWHDNAAQGAWRCIAGTSHAIDDLRQQIDIDGEAAERTRMCRTG
jgi:hypothetical protein